MGSHYVAQAGLVSRPKMILQCQTPKALGLQHFGRLRQADHLRSGVQDQPGQRGKTPSLLKMQKSAERGGGHLQFQLLGRLMWDNCLNLGDRSCNCKLYEERGSICFVHQYNPVYSTAPWDMRQGLTLSPRLEFSGTIIAHLPSNSGAQAILPLQPPK
ncbi:hypothetical protein AAY473_028584 [Plecturocebus cupreus]